MASGSIIKCLINRIPFNVAGDANASRTPERTTEGIRHSGGNSMKVTLNPNQVEGLTLIVTPLEYQQLEIIAALSNVPMSYTENDGSVWSCTGSINLDNRETEENRCDVTMIPDNAGWELAAAGA